MTMSKRVVAKSLVDKVMSLVAGAGKMVVVCHMTPDGDAMGSSLCLKHTLEAIGKKVCVVVPDCPPGQLMFLPGAEDIVVASYHPERAAALLRNTDLIWCLDFNDLKRIDRMAPLVEASHAPRIVVDHHLNPQIKADVLVSNPDKSSTCALLFLLLEDMGLVPEMPVEGATCCCCGMMTDTGNFSYNSNDPELYRILSILVAKGVDKDAVYTRVFNTTSESRVRIMGYGQYAKMQLLPEHKAAVITLSKEELDRMGYRRGDTEALVNVPLGIPEIVFSIFLREDDAGYVKISMRSKGAFSVKDLCERHFSGGGHCNAAGGEMRSSLDDALKRVMSLMPECDEMLEKIEKNNI